MDIECIYQSDRMHLPQEENVEENTFKQNLLGVYKKKYCILTAVDTWLTVTEQQYPQ